MDNQSSTGILHSVVKSLGPTERIIFYLLAIAIFVSGLSLAWKLNSAFLSEVPVLGGAFTEGVVGSPRFLNPLLSIGDTDKSIVSLVYSGLLKHDKKGDYVPDLAEYYSVSDDGLVYSVKIRDDAYFHDGKPVTSEDVAFTRDMALEPILKSPKRGNWEGVGVEIINDKEIKFILKKPYSPFLENLTAGILPKHIWREATPEEFPFSQYNIEPVGSGPYEVSRIKYNSSGVPEIITFKSFKKYIAGRPYIKEVKIRFFKNEENMIKAFESGDIDAVAGLSPETAENMKKKGFDIKTSVMPRVFGAFLNQNQATFLTNIEVRRALNESVDKQGIIKEVLKGYGFPLSGPVPYIDRSTIVNSNVLEVSSTATISKIEIARKILTDAGWKINSNNILEKKTKSGATELKFSIATSDAPELKKTADILSNTWNSLGAQTDVKVFESGDLNQNVIKPRKYNVLLFGFAIGKDMDFYPFWHSSQRIDPGLNIALYANITVDKLLEDMRLTSNKSIKEQKLLAFNNEISKDLPAIFTYAPKFIYLISSNIKNVEIPSIANQSDRFIGIENWFIETDRVWDIFGNKIK